MTPTACPSCEADLKGDPIKEEMLDWYDGETHFSKVVGISDGDSVWAWHCPACGHQWSRTEKLGGFRTCSVVLG